MPDPCHKYLPAVTFLVAVSTQTVGRNTLLCDDQVWLDLEDVITDSPHFFLHRQKDGGKHTGERAASARATDGTSSCCSSFSQSASFVISTFV